VTSILSIKPGDGGVTLENVWTQDGDGLATGYTSMVPVRIGADTVLYAHDRSTGKASVYRLTGSAPFVERLKATVDLADQPWESLSTFVIGNQPYLMTYERTHGHFGFFAIAPDLTVSKPYLFVLPRNTPTKGFTSVGVYPTLGQQITITGYDFDTGIVANFSLAVTPTSTGGLPPLLALNTWYHQWAKGWTRFAFFQLGGANFFFKINTAKLNVNIDHMQDNPAMGSVEVGSYLQDQLPDAMVISDTAHVPWPGGEPYLLTYVGDTGATVVYRIHADCQGWTKLGEIAGETSAARAISYRVDDTTFALLYQDH
jgi:hypothetical protein